MSELEAKGAKEQSAVVSSHRTASEGSSDTDISDRSQEHRAISGSLPSVPTHPLQEYGRKPEHNAPRWLRPFFSLRIQLTTVYGVLLLLTVMITTILASQRTSSLFMTLLVTAIIVLGIAAAFVFITILLRPLWRVTDAAQAIAAGDFEQRERLPLRLPPQDEIDRLAGSLSEMAKRLEDAEQIQDDANERFRQFFSDASHQLRTPLTSIRGFTDLLLRGAKDDPETAQRVLTLMKAQSERMSTLINDILTISRLDNRQPLKTQYIDIVELAMEGIEQTRLRATDDRRISLVIATRERLGMQADRERIKQLFFILLDNALKHGRPAPDGQITVQLEKNKGQIIIRIIDNGEGIAQEDKAHIFEAFYRGRHHTSSSNGTTPTPGAGLGLTIASAIVRAHKGSIALDSAPGKDTVFIVTLPCLD